jgi:trehalose synthase
MTKQEHKIIRLEEYEQFVGTEVVERVAKKAESLRGLRVAHVNSTHNGGGVAEILSSLTLLMNSAGIDTEWRVLEGTPEFFNVTKKIHNALQGGNEQLNKDEKETYEAVVYENALRNKLDHDRVIIHDPQPLPLISHYHKKNLWLWQCHVDLTAPNPAVWDYLLPFIEQYLDLLGSFEPALAPVRA